MARCRAGPAVARRRSPNPEDEATLRCEWNVPGVVSVEPARIVAALHPGISSRNGLDARRARLTVSFVALKRSLNIVNIGKAARQYGGVFDGGRGALCHVGRHRMAGVAQQDYAAIAPARQRIAVE